MRRVLEVQELIDAAAGAAGSDDFGETGWREGLEVLVASANAEARLNPTGELTLTMQVGRSLVNRVGIRRHHRADPTLAASPVTAPVFILGLPRCGTTLLSYLLDEDPANRSLSRGECFAGGALDVDTAQREMDALYAVLPEFKAIHYETGSGPTECITLLGQEFRSVHFETLAHLPTYGEWHLACDMGPAYDWHRTVLQVLQHREPGRWVLKSPCHNLALDALVAAYPDARFVFPHRDPVVAVGSAASLVSVLAGFSSDENFDREHGARWLELAGRMLDGLLAFRAQHGDERFLDVDYQDLVADPMRAAGEIYEWLGWPMTAEGERAMNSYLAAATRDRFGRHTYDLAQFGLTAHAIRDRLADYCERYGF
jgi:hypothetical protein